MKKIIVFCFLFLGFLTKADNKNIEFSDQRCVAQICCVRTASNSSSGESVSVKACVESTGDAVIDKGKACSRAKDQAVKSLQVLNDTPTN